MSDSVMPVESMVAQILAGLAARRGHAPAVPLRMPTGELMMPTGDWYGPGRSRIFRGDGVAWREIAWADVRPFDVIVFVDIDQIATPATLRRVLLGLVRQVRSGLLQLEPALDLLEMLGTAMVGPETPLASAVPAGAVEALRQQIRQDTQRRQRVAAGTGAGTDSPAAATPTRDAAPATPPADTPKADPLAAALRCFSTDARLRVPQ